MGKVCEECTNNCLMMHRRHKNPASLVTTFVKVMIGDNYSKTLFLPPNFACRVKNLVGQKTSLEDLNGEKSDVKVAEIDDRLAFEEGWENFALKHGLQKGDILVFHCIMKSHFVVLMYGATGCPELRHFGFNHNSKKETKKSDNNLIDNGQSSSKVHTNCNNLSHESSSKSEPLVHGVNNIKTMNKNINESKMLPNENTTNTQQLIASSSRPVDKENDQRSGRLVENTLPDYLFSESPTTVKSLCYNDNGHEQDKCRRNSLQPVVVESDVGQKNNVVARGGGSDETKINRIQSSVEPNDGLKNNVAASGGGSDDMEGNRIRNFVEPYVGQKNNVAVGRLLDETETNKSRKSVESDGEQKNNVAAIGGSSYENDKDRLREVFETRMKMARKRRESTVIQNQDTHSNSMHKRLRSDDVPIPQTAPPANTPKSEPITSVLNSHNSGYPSTPTAKWTESTKEKPTINHGSVGMVKTEPRMNHGSAGMIKLEPKSEPDDYDEAPLIGSSNTSFSATMTSYQYLELPSCVQSKSKVILLRNGADLWPVLYQSKYGLKALTQTWSVFAKEKGIKPGDVCEFVLESEPTIRCTSSVYSVRVMPR